MAEHRGTTYKNSRVRVDNEEFHYCTFDDCVIVYAASAGVTFERCSFNKCSFAFEGAASNAVNFMKALYQLSPELIERTFDAIRLGI
jgi:hypothetical protein